MGREREVRFTIDQDYLEALQNRLGLKKSTDVTRTALTLLEWASSEAANGRVILSSTEEGKDLHRLVMPELQRVKG